MAGEGTCVSTEAGLPSALMGYRWAVPRVEVTATHRVSTLNAMSWIVLLVTPRTSL